MIANNFKISLPYCWFRLFILSHLQTHFDTSAADNFWKLEAKEEIANEEQLLILTQCFQLDLIILSFIEIFYIFAEIICLPNGRKYVKYLCSLLWWEDILTLFSSRRCPVFVFFHLMKSCYLGMDEPGLSFECNRYLMQCFQKYCCMFQFYLYIDLI